jgi:TonB family protein
MGTRFGATLLASAAASAAAHALVLATFSRVRVGTAPPPAPPEMAVVYDGPEPSPNDREFDMGMPGASGYATHDAPGRQEQAAREAPQDQPSLSLDPVGTSLNVDVPSAPGQAAYEPVVPQVPVPPAAAAVISPAPTQPMPQELAERVRQERIDTVRPDAPVNPPPVAVEPVKTEVALAMPPRPAPAQAAAGSGADPAPQSDSESDAFSVLGSAQFRTGRVVVRSGRQVKTRRPKIGLAGMVDLAEHSAVQVVLKVSVDATGKVTDVQVAKSSGSNEIDQPCRVAMYDWWFEPKTDAAGHAQPDKFQFTISFR